MCSFTRNIPALQLYVISSCNCLVPRHINELRWTSTVNCKTATWTSSQATAICMPYSPHPFQRKMGSKQERLRGGRWKGKGKGEEKWKECKAKKRERKWEGGKAWKDRERGSVQKVMQVDARALLIWQHWKILLFKCYYIISVLFVHLYFMDNKICIFRKDMGPCYFNYLIPFKQKSLCAWPYQ